MECLRLTVYSFIVFGFTIFQSEAEFFDPTSNIFNTQQRDSASNNVINSLLSPFRDYVDNQRPDLRQLKNRESVNARHWWKPVSTQSPIFNDQTTTKSTTSDYDAIVAERFPEGVKLLENLKELNKLKEERERKAGNDEREAWVRKDGYVEREAWTRKDGYGEKEARERKDGYGERDVLERNDGNGKKEAHEYKVINSVKEIVVSNHTLNSNETKPNDNYTKSKKNDTKSKDNNIKSIEKPINQNESDKENSGKDSATGVITKKLFYYQVQPIRPESERDFIYEIMYYVN